MDNIFPELIKKLPKADIPVKGVEAFLSQGPDHQVVFMEFAEDIDVPEHEHAAQWGVVLAGSIQLSINGECFIYNKGDQYFIPAGVKHAAHISAGYADLTFFDQKDRYGVK